jgi:hypothetical protein
MKEWLLRTQDSYYRIVDQRLQNYDTIEEPVPCLLSPSFNYRKYLTIPTDTTRDPEDVRLELFKKSLPESLEDVKYQFVELGQDQDGNTKVLVLALNSDRYREILQDNVPRSGLYFFEALMAQVALNQTAEVRIEFPEGSFFGVFKPSLTWSRFLHRGNRNQEAMTDNYIEREYGKLSTETQITKFIQEDGLRSEWGDEVDAFLPESTPVELDLTSESGSIWASIKFSVLTGLVLLFLASLTWIGYQKTLKYQLQQWTRQTYESVTGETTSQPMKMVRERLEATKTSPDRQAPQYPRLMVLDEHLSTFPFRLLRLNMSSDRTQVVGLVESVGRVGSLRDRLLQSDRVQTVSIESTDTMKFNQFNYRVNLEIVWQS